MDGKFPKAWNDHFAGKVEPIRECLVWTKGKDDDGYGATYFNSKQWSAHRLSFHLAFGGIPPKKWVLHKCDNPSCVNPNHLFVGTGKDNVHDCIKKGRWIVVRGQDRSFAVLTNEDVAKIRSSYIKYSKSHNIYSFARIYNVSPTTIHAVLTGRSWSHLKRNHEHTTAWSYEWKVCRNCSRADEDHRGHGLCNKCYNTVYYKLIRYSEFFGIKDEVTQLLNKQP